MNIYDYVRSEEKTYQTRPVPVADGYDWSMYEKIREWTLYKDGQFLQGNSTEERDNKPNKNIILPILNMSYRTEGFDVKDIELYVDDEDNYHKSFLAKKYHDKMAPIWGLDKMIDEIVQSYVDYGGVLVKKVKGNRPEVIPLQKLAFCDQTDILSGPFAIKHQYSVDQLLEKSGTWNKESIDDIIANARMEKDSQQNQGVKAKTPGKYIEVYEVHGVFHTDWLTSDEMDYYNHEKKEYVRQIHIVSYTNTEDPRNSRGVTLFKGKEGDNLFKFLKRDSRFGTALGRSAIEELVESQVWTNYSLIQIKTMLDKAALMLGVTDDPSFRQKNKFTDLEKGEWLVKNPNTSLEAFEFPASNLANFENSMVMWESHARTTGSANDAALGVSPSSGTPFKLQDLVVNQNNSVHEWRRGIIATFVEELYREWILPGLVSEMNTGFDFMSELSLDELQEVATRVVDNHVNDKVKERILNGGIVDPANVEAYKSFAKEQFMKGDNRRLIEIMKDDFADIPVDVRINVAGKQKNLNAITDKIVNIFREVIVNPQILQNPNAVKAFNQILEFSGLTPINFKTDSSMQLPAQQLQLTQ